MAPVAAVAPSPPPLNGRRSGPRADDAPDARRRRRRRRPRRIRAHRRQSRLRRRPADVRVTTWMLAAGSSEAERSLIAAATAPTRRRSTIDAGEARTLQARSPCRRPRSTATALLPVVVADAALRPRRRQRSPRHRPLRGRRAGRRGARPLRHRAPVGPARRRRRPAAGLRSPRPSVQAQLVEVPVLLFFREEEKAGLGQAQPERV